MSRIAAYAALSLITVVALVLTACTAATPSPDDRPTPEPTVPLATAAPTPVPLATPTPVPEPTTPPTSTPILTATPTPASQPVPITAPIPLSAPTPASVPYSTPSPNPTAPTMLGATPTPTPFPWLATPTPASPGLTIRGLSIPWARQFPSHWAMLKEIESSHPGVAGVILGLHWVTDDNFNDDESFAFYILGELILNFPPGDSSLTQTIAGLQWLEDGISADESQFLLDLHFLMSQGNTPTQLQRALASTAPGQWRATSRPPAPVPTRPPQATLGPAVPLSDLPWRRDGLNDVETRALHSLERISADNPSGADVVLSYSWVADSINENEMRALSVL